MNPMSCLKRPERKALAAPCGVTQRDRVSLRIKPDFVSARMLPGATRTHVDLPLVTVLFRSVNQLQKRSGRSILFRIVMDLPSPGAIFGFVLEQLCSFRNQSLEHRDADGEIRAPYKTRARLLN